MVRTDDEAEGADSVLRCEMTYTTKSGDQWDGIAFRELGSTDYTGELMSANTAYRNFFVFPAGIVLKLPEIGERTGENLPPWKQVTA